MPSSSSASARQASPGTVAGWIAETEAERARHVMSLRQSATRARMGEEEIEAMISRLGGLAVTLHDADPDDKSEVYQQLGLRLIYQPGQQVVRGAISLDTPGHWFFDGVRGGIDPTTPYCSISHSAEIDL